MARCATCKNVVLFGGVAVNGIRYCSKGCSSKAPKLQVGLMDEGSKKAPIVGKGVATLVWALIALLASLFNFGLDLNSYPSGAGKSYYYSSLGYASTPFILSLAVLFFREHRSAHSYFKAAGIFSLLVLFSSLGKVKPPSV